MLLARDHLPNAAHPLINRSCEKMGKLIKLHREKEGEKDRDLDDSYYSLWRNRIFSTHKCLVMVISSVDFIDIYLAIFNREKCSN